MADNKQQSNPFSTGSGGPNFEARVQAAFTVLMLSGCVAPCLPPYPIIKLKLQGRYAGFKTEDFIVFSKHLQTEREAKLLAQIKHGISVTRGNARFAEVIHGAWNDFNGEIFDSGTDAIALITGPLSATDINNVRPILEWARHSENEEDFLAKINAGHFSSEAKKEKLEAFKTHLKAANNGTDVSDKQLWEFLKVFHLIGYDLDAESGSTLSLLHSLISRSSNEPSSLLWTRVVDAVQTANQNAGTITLETLPEEIRAAFRPNASSSWSSDVDRLKEHGDYILHGIKTTVGGVHVDQSECIAQLFALTESSQFVLVSGARGARKSSLIRVFSDLVRNHSPIFCVRTEDLDESHLDKVFSTMNLQGSLSDLEAGFALMPKKYLIIESLEKLLELRNTSAFTDLLQVLNKHHGWSVIASCRDYAYQQITFNFLQPSGISFQTLMMSGFSDVQVQSLCEQLKPLEKFALNSALKPLLKNPFFADLAFRVLETGLTFSPKDGEKEFRAAVWRDVIAKEQERTSGMPPKRKETFINIAVKRAKQMTYGVPESGFDGDAVLRLEEDNIVRRDLKNSLVIPAHDVLEDWALEQFIEDAYCKHSNNLHDFLAEIGPEPAINRAFRLWLHQKLRYGLNVNDVVHSILNAQDIQRYWQDETITAVLQGDNPDEFLESLRNQLFSNDGELLKRFCFVLRIACQTPDQKLIPEGTTSEKKFADALFLRPYGQGWKALICFLLKNKELQSKALAPHVIALLNDWASSLHIEEEQLTPSREAGLLSLHLLEGLKESYSDGTDREKLLGIIIKTYPAISDEFIKLLETDVFVTNIERRQDRHRYVDQFCEMIFSTLYSATLCRHNPDLLIKLALFEWFINETPEYEEYLYDLDISGRFGLHEDRNEFSPASGAKGPFQYLLNCHPRKGLDFIIKTLNKAADKYAHSDLDGPRDLNARRTRRRYSEPIIEQVEIQLNDGSSVMHYCSGRLWGAYRGHSVVPDLLQCALMALENWLITYIEDSENSDQKIIEWLFDHILRNSNSVMPTAVLASVASGFPEKVGKAALPLLRSMNLYFLDMERTVHECGGNEINWHKTGLQRDLLADLYTEERRTAALRPWRKEHLETLVKLLQFSEYRDDALAAIDKLRKSMPNDERARFLLHRIDSRDWEPTEDRENNRIIFEPKRLEPDLKEVQQQTQEEMQSTNRYTALYVWAKKTFAREPLEKDYYETWGKALAEAKELFKKIKTGNASDLATMLSHSSFVTAAAVFLRDHSEKLTDEDALWCADLLIRTVMANADTDDMQAIADVTDHDGAAASATILPILLDFASENEKKLEVKRVIVTALTHANEQVRNGAADGIREHLWQRDPEFAQNCIIGAIAYARLERNNQLEIRRVHFDARKKVRAKLQAKKDEFRDQFTRGELSRDLDQITLQTHSSWLILIPSLMIPDGSTKPEHVKLLSQMLAIFFETEQEKAKRYSERDNELRIDYKITSHFAQRFAKYLFHLHQAGLQAYIEPLRTACDTAPSLMNLLILYVAVEAEKTNQEEIYWQLWKALSQKVQGIAIEIGQDDSDYRIRDDRKILIRGMLHADTEWQKIDFENQAIANGKDMILQFVDGAGKNPDVFEALAKLMFYFPSIFFESGIHLLSKHQREKGGTRLFSGVNTSFYLERSIQRFLQLDQTGPLPKNMHDSCFILLNGIVETASPRAYYLREYLVRSRRTI